MRIDRLVQGGFVSIALATPFVLFQGLPFIRPPMQMENTPAPVLDLPLPESESPPRIEPLDPKPRLLIQFSESLQFGIVCPRLRDPIDPEKPKRLTGDEQGRTNNTVIRVDGRDYHFGSNAPGARWISSSATDRGMDDGPAWEAVWELEFGRIRIAQRLDFIMGG
jgi:hypothetical protein